MKRRIQFVGIFLPIWGCSEGLQQQQATANTGEQTNPLPTQSTTSWQFTDVTADTGIDFHATFGDDHFSYILEDTGSGVAMIDANLDGLLDVYVLNGCWVDGVSEPAAKPDQPARNALYQNLGNFRFRDITSTSGTGDTGYGMGAVVGDYDNDGDQDLYVLNWGPNVLYRNDGGTFVDVTETAGVAGDHQLNGQRKWSVNGFFFDPDGDGDLDLYVANYLAFDPDFDDPNLPEEYPYPGPESYLGQPSYWYRNNGDGTFSEMIEEMMQHVLAGKTMGAVAADLDGDGVQEIVEAVDDMQNFLFHRSDDGRFQEQAVAAGIAYDSAGAPMASMHVSIGDIDGDLQPDLFVPDLAQGCLYHNRGDLLFDETSTAAGIGQVLAGSGAWGSYFADFDNDTDLDLMVVLGGAFDLQAKETDRLFVNDGTGRFRDLSAELGGSFTTARVSRGAAFGDLDNDGDLDFVVSGKEVGSNISVLRNDLPTGHHWLQLKLVGQRSNRDGIGARVIATVNGRRMLREVGRSGSYLSQNDVRVHLGLGTNDRVDELTVFWPSGTIQELGPVTSNQSLDVVEPER